VKVYDTVQNMMQDVNAGRIKAGFADYPIMSYFLAQGEFPDVQLVKTYKPVVPASAQNMCIVAQFFTLQTTNNL
jgi:polar amino acid transport system substrate-binding protein